METEGRHQRELSAGSRRSEGRGRDGGKREREIKTEIKRTWQGRVSVSE